MDLKVKMEWEWEQVLLAISHVNEPGGRIELAAQVGQVGGGGAGAVEQLAPRGGRAGGLAAL